MLAGAIAVLMVLDLYSAEGSTNPVEKERRRDDQSLVNVTGFFLNKLGFIKYT
jgi:hypothetical protein